MQSRVREIALDLHVVGRDGSLARHADLAGAGADPLVRQVLLRERAGEDLLADAVRSSP
jgi:hypothetical protein